MDWIDIPEGLVILALSVVAAAVQINVRITAQREHIKALERREDKCEEDRARLWAEKADKETTAEFKADIRRTMNELKLDINHRLDAISAMLTDLQKKIS